MWLWEAPDTAAEIPPIIPGMTNRPKPALTAAALSLLSATMAFAPNAWALSLADGQADAGAIALPRKQVAAPPSDILSGRVVLPSPAAVGSASRTAMVDVTLDGSGRAALSVPTGSDGWVELALLARDPAGVSLTVDGPGRLERGDEVAVPGRSDVTATRVVLRGPSPTAGAPEGSRRLTLSAAPGETLVAVVPSDGPWGLRSHVTDWRLTADRDHVVQAWLEHESAAGQPVFAPALAPTLTLWEGGQRLDMPLADDGLHGDGAPADGVFGALLPPLAPGHHVVRVTLAGTAPDGSPVLLTDQTILPIAAPSLALGAAATSRVTADVLQIDVPVRLLDVPTTVHASAEVWGVDAAGDAVPVAWLSGMLDPQRGANGPRLTLPLHGAWLDLADAGAPLHLRHVRVQHADSHVVLASRERMALRAERLPPPLPLLGPGNQPPAPILTGGLLPLAPPASAGSATGQYGPQGALERALLLTHGYCADGNPWPQAQFSGDLLILDDPEANRSNDAFAQLLGQLGADVFSHGVVGHSQGGNASLHLLTFYWSGLDLADGGRRIQSVGSPYQGTPLAGAAAGVGQIFGAGCGENDDLSPNGAVLWLSTIPTWARAEVDYYTTEPTSGSCNFLSNLFLPGADDGVVQVAAGQLPGANSMGNTVGWCHTTDMSQPAQYFDASRNALLDANAAR